jgi:hypothetical protein
VHVPSRFVTAMMEERDDSLRHTNDSNHDTHDTGD